jgi:hypothetical protein
MREHIKNSWAYEYCHYSNHNLLRTSSYFSVVTPKFLVFRHTSHCDGYCVLGGGLPIFKLHRNQIIDSCQLGID